MPSEKQSIIWQLVPCSQHLSEDVELPTKTANLLRRQKDCREEDGACSWEKYKNLITSHMPKMKNITPYKMVAINDELRG